MGTPQDIFDKACKAYKKFELSLYSTVSERTEYDAESAIIDFDTILQSLLLDIGISDGEFHTLERQFVENIVEHGDVLTYLKNEKDINLEWEALEVIDIETCEKLTILLHELIEETVYDFISKLVVSDLLNHNNDIYDNLENTLKTIVSCFVSIDGKIEDEENDTAIAALDNMIFSQWETFKNKILDDLQNSNEETTEDDYENDVTEYENDEYSDDDFYSYISQIDMSLLDNNIYESEGHTMSFDGTVKKNYRDMIFDAIQIALNNQFNENIDYKIVEDAFRKIVNNSAFKINHKQKSSDQIVECLSLLTTSEQKEILKALKDFLIAKQDYNNNNISFDVSNPNCYNGIIEIIAYKYIIKKLWDIFY